MQYGQYFFRTTTWRYNRYTDPKKATV